MTLEDLQNLENLCRFMIAWAEREPDSILPDPLNLSTKDVKEIVKDD